jgi:signal transduction histidine kinase
VITRAHPGVLQRRFQIAWLSSAVVVAAAAAVGLLAEAVAFEWDDLRGWAPDLAVGWLFIGGGVATHRVLDGSRAGWLMVAAGFAWFIGNFESSGVPALSWLGESGKFLYLGVLVHLAVVLVEAVIDRRVASLAVGAAYVAVVWPLESPTSIAARMLLLGSVVLVLTVWAIVAGLRRHGPLDPSAVVGSVLVALVLIGVAIARLVLPDSSYEDVTLAFDLSLCFVAIVVSAEITRAGLEREQVTELVVELGERPSAPIRDTLRRTLGDPTLEIGYRLHGTTTYVDRAGRAVELPASEVRRVVTPVGDEAFLIHDRSLLADDRVVAAVGAAARLASTNARLQAELREQIRELLASRRRLVLARDDSRRLLEQDLHEGAELRLTAVSEALAAVRPQSPDVGAALERARAVLSQTESDLSAVAAGLHPRALAERGLDGAIASLAALAPVPVEVAVHGRKLDAAVEATAYFLCAEGLANVAKHARATHATVAVARTDGNLSVVIEDDGVGGAVPSGAGLRGLADRVEELGGSLAIESPRRGGTRLAAEIPLGGEPI